MADVRKQLARAFYQTHSFKWDPDKGFKLASGQVSPYYVDCRTLMAYAGSRRLVAQLAYEALATVELDCLGGLEIGAISILASSPGKRGRMCLCITAPSRATAFAPCLKSRRWNLK